MDLLDKNQSDGSEVNTPDQEPLNTTEPDVKGEGHPEASEPEVADSNLTPALNQIPGKDGSQYGDYAGEPVVIEKAFTYPTHADPARLKDTTGGLYLDDKLRLEAEIERARVEGREPDLKNPPGVTGTPLLPTQVVKQNVNNAHDIPVSSVQNVVVGQVEEPKDESYVEPEPENKAYLSAEALPMDSDPADVKQSDDNKDA